MEKYNIIFIGAGVSNLVAANRLLDYSIDNFIILEKGKVLEKRKCVSEKEMTCSLCSKGCPTIEGVGGANAIHGNKLCYFPASNHVKKLFGERENDNILNYLNNLLSPYFDKNFVSNGDNLSYKKKYNSDVLDSNHFAQMINMLTSRLADKIITESNVITIDKFEDNFLLETDRKVRYICKKLVLGTGRSSYKQLKTILDNFNIKYNIQNQDIGIRIETHKNNFSEEYYYQVDPKFKFFWKGLGEGRTFCAHNQGYVVPVKFGKSFFADGAFSNYFKANNNIALMVRSETPLSINEIEEWCLKINKSSNNRLIIGEIDLRAGSQKLVSQIINMIPVYPTISHKKLLTNLLEKLFITGPKIFIDNPKMNTKLTIYGPAIDRYWVSPILNNDFSTKEFKNLYIIGDAAGISRGFVQAMFSGAAWADQQFEKNSITKTKKAWLNLV